MKAKANAPVREAAERNHLYLWQVAAIMGISYSGFMQKMRFEWSDEEQRSVIQKIKDFAKENDHEEEV